MNRKSIFASAALAVLAVGQVHADNSFVVTDTSSGAELMSAALSTVSRICFKDGKMTVTFADKSTRDVAFTTSTKLLFEGEPTGVAEVVGGAESLQLKYDGDFVAATGLAAPANAVVYNVSGQCAQTIRSWDGSPVSVAALSSGVYILKVNNKSIKFVRK